MGCVGGAMTLFALGKCGGLITIDSALDLTIHVAVEVRARNYNLCFNWRIPIDPATLRLIRTRTQLCLEKLAAEYYSYFSLLSFEL